MGRGGRKLLRLTIGMVCLGAMLWTVVALGPRRVAAVALEAHPAWLALSVLPLLGRFLIWALKWTRMLAREQRVPYSLALRIVAAGSFVNLTTPTAKLAGGVVRAVLIHRRRGWRVSAAYGWALADQVTNVLGHLLLYAVCSLAVAAALPLGRWNLIFGVSGAAALAGLALLVALRGPAWNRLRDRGVCLRLYRLVPARFRGEATEDESVERVRRIFGPLLDGGGSPLVFVADMCWAALSFASLCLANAMVLRALGVDTSLLLIVTAVMLGYLAGVLVGAWGGIGVTEAALTALFVQFGLPADQAAAGALLHRGIFYAAVLLLGGWSLFHETR